MESVALGGGFGVELRGIDGNDIREAEHGPAIRALVARHALVLLRGQNLDEEAHARIAGLLGPLQGPGGAGPEDGGPLWHYVTNQPIDGRPALPHGPVACHYDSCFRPMTRPFMSLHALQATAHGGETVFSDGAAAWDALDAATRGELLASTARQSYLRGTTSREENFRSSERMTRDSPAAIRHPGSGRTVLYVCRLMTERLAPMDEARSERLLAGLFDHLESPAFAYVHPWRAGDLLLWDNMRLAHSRRAFDAAEPRMLRRMMIGTAEPQAAH